ncbi:Uncharacterised protein [Collinsella intestinalis]|nr:Uncharacterised protein [Collinsella intestinalis]
MVYALSVRREDGAFQRFACSGAHLVDRGKSHTAALVKLDVEAYRLKWRRAHTAHVLDQVFR